MGVRAEDSPQQPKVSDQGKCGPAGRGNRRVITPSTFAQIAKSQLSGLPISTDLVEGVKRADENGDLAHAPVGVRSGPRSMRASGHRSTLCELGPPIAVGPRMSGAHISIDVTS